MKIQSFSFSDKVRTVHVQYWISEKLNKCIFLDGSIYDKCFYLGKCSYLTFLVQKQQNFMYNYVSIRLLNILNVFF